MPAGAFCIRVFLRKIYISLRKIRVSLYHILRGKTKDITLRLQAFCKEFTKTAKVTEAEDQFPGFSFPDRAKLFHVSTGDFILFLLI